MVTASQTPDRAAAAFLRKGIVGRADPSELAAACDRLVRAETQRSLPKAVLLARQFVAQVRRRPTMPLQLALRALGWAHHCSGQYAQALKAYREARRLVVRQPFDRARIDRILIDVYMYLGNQAEARRRARLAIDTFQRLDDPGQVARTRINYGNLYHRQDRHRLARRQYELARQYLDSHPGNDLVRGLCYYNLANTSVQLFDFNEADRYYRKARERFDRLEYHLFVTECDYGLAWLAMLDGDYNVALRLLYRCEEAYLNADQRKGVMLCRLDRAEAYLGLNLFPDALEAARDAERLADRLGIRYESAKAAFFRARAAYASGRDRDVTEALARAKAGFRKEGNRAFEAAVALFELQVGSSRRTDAARMKRIRQLAARSQLPLWRGIGDLQILSHDPDDVETRRRLARNPAVQTVPHMFAHWQTLQGDSQFERGHPARAMKHWTRAAEVLDVVRAKLPPVELQATFMRGRSDPYERIIANELERDPGRAAAWADRFKTVGAWAASGDSFAAVKKRTRAEQSLTDLAQRFSALANQLGRTSGTRSARALAGYSSLKRLQRQARDSLAMMERQRPRMKPWLDRFTAEVRKVSAKMPIVQFHSRHDDLVAFVHCDGETRSYRYAGALDRIRRWHGVWQIQLSRALLSDHGCSRADLRDEHDLFTELGEYLWAPLDMPERDGRILLVPDGLLAGLPWPAFRHRGRPLIESHRLVLAPSIQHHLRASQLVCRGRRFGLFVGDKDGLEHAQEELSNLLNAAADVHLCDPCRRADWPDDGEWKVWHFTGHARHRSDNPFYSSLQLADGPLFGADFRLKTCRVELATLAACRTAHQSALPGEEATGLVRCLLEMGTRNVVGSHWPVSDRSAADWMKSFYRSIFDSRSVSHAVREASLTTKEKYPSVYDWASFSVYGTG